MSVVLNFQKKDIAAIEKSLQGMEKIPCTSKFEILRFKDKDSMVVVYNSGKTVIQGKNPEKTKNLILENLGLLEEVVLGFDETGRGENFGPMVVAGVLGDTNRLREVRDSKKTKKIDEKFQIVSKNFLASAAVTMNAEYIDRLRKKGLNLNQIESKIIEKITELFEEMGENPRTIVDGNPLSVKKNNIIFLPKADDLEPVVGAASINAKFLREKSADKSKRKTWKNG